MEFAEGEGQIEYSFVIAKSRTASTPFLTVQRLELHAAVIDARMDSPFKREIGINLLQSLSTGQTPE